MLEGGEWLLEELRNRRRRSEANTVAGTRVGGVRGRPVGSHDHEIKSPCRRCFLFPPWTPGGLPLPRRMASPLPSTLQQERVDRPHGQRYPSKTVEKPLLGRRMSHKKRADAKGTLICCRPPPLVWMVVEPFPCYCSDCHDDRCRECSPHEPPRSHAWCPSSSPVKESLLTHARRTTGHRKRRRAWPSRRIFQSTAESRVPQTGWPPSSSSSGPQPSVSFPPRRWWGHEVEGRTPKEREWVRKGEEIALLRCEETPRRPLCSPPQKSQKKKHRRWWWKQLSWVNGTGRCEDKEEA